MVRLRDALLMLIAFVALGSFLGAFVRLTLRPWWRRRLVRVAVFCLISLDIAVPSVWYLLMRFGYTDPADGLVTVQLALFFGQFALGGALVLAALLSAAGRLRLPGEAQPVASSRRRFLCDSAAVVLPVAAAAVGIGGVVESRSPVRVRRRLLQIPDLPRELSGLRILHFSDVHLWKLVTVDDLDRALQRAPRGEYDLVCVTGDLADDITQLPAALDLIAGLDAPLGHFACLGNHEHARGLGEALTTYADSRVTLLRKSGRTLVHNSQPFVLAGIDDLRAVPRVTQRDFYPDQLHRAMGPTAPMTFSIVLSHRPSVLPYAAAAGANLVLAGHTHGGQMAIGGVSILQLNGATRWAWGEYRHDRTVMHVTCGMGQWFPFRLGCPPEMVLLELATLPNAVANP